MFELMSEIIEKDKKIERLNNLIKEIHNIVYADMPYMYALIEIQDLLYKFYIEGLNNEN